MPRNLVNNHNDFGQLWRSVKHWIPQNLKRTLAPKIIKFTGSCFVILCLCRTFRISSLLLLPVAVRAQHVVVHRRRCGRWRRRRRWRWCFVWISFRRQNRGKLFDRLDTTWKDQTRRDRRLRLFFFRWSVFLRIVFLVGIWIWRQNWIWILRGNNGG